MILLVLLLYALCGLSFTISKMALIYGAPLFFVGIRMTIAGVLLVSYYIWKYGLKSFCKKDSMLFGAAIFFHIFFAYSCDAWALQRMSSIESAFIYNFSPFIAALCSYVVFKERMTLPKWIGMLIGFGALVWVLLGCTELLCCQNIWITSVMFFAVVSSAYGWIIVRQLLQRGYSIIMINGISMTVGGILALSSSYLFENWQKADFVTNWPHFLLSLVLIIVLMNGAFYNLYGYLLKVYTATFLSFAGFTCPFFAQFFGWLFLGEELSAHIIAATLIVAIGLYIFYRSELKQGYIQDT